MSFNLQDSSSVNISGSGTANADSSTRLTDIGDVTITNPQTNNKLNYNGTEWVNSATDDLNGLSDVTISGPTITQTLLYNGSTWANAPLTLNDLGDVNITNPTNVQGLRYDGSEWVNAKAGAETLGALSDVVLNAPAAGDALTRDTDWENSPFDVNSLTNVNAPSPNIGNALVFNGSQWTSTTPLALNLNQLTDVTLTSEETNQELVYNGTVWVNWSPQLGDLTDVTITAPTTVQALVYNGSIWVNGKAGAASLDGLDDVIITSPTADSALIYNGSAWIDRSFDLNQLADVQIDLVSSGQALIYNGEGAWVNSSTNNGNLEGLTDVTVSSPQNGQPLVYDGSVWVNRTDELGDLQDVTVSNPLNGQSLIYNGTGWENGIVSSTLDELSDCTISSPVLNQYIGYDGASWINATGPTLGSLNDVTLSLPVEGQALTWLFTDWTNTIRPGYIRVTGFTTVSSATLPLTQQGDAIGSPTPPSTDGIFINLPSNAFFLLTMSIQSVVFATSLANTFMELQVQDGSLTTLETVRLYNNISANGNVYASGYQQYFIDTNLVNKDTLRFRVEGFGTMITSISTEMSIRQLQ